MPKTLLVLVCTACIVSLSGAAPPERPNILLIMADDVGIEGLECYGGDSYRTPNLDRMAAEGIRFTRAYSQPLCTPTRVQIMTGKYNHRNWSSFGILDPSETTFGHLMQSAGYATAIFGKWQLYSYDPPDLPGAAARRGTGMHPKDAGFDEFALYHALHTEDKGSRYTSPTMLEGTAGASGQLKRYDRKYGEDIWVEKTIDFLDRHRDQPAFVYYPMALPHWPFEPTPNTPHWDPGAVQKEDYKYITDMIEYMDTTVGSLIDKLREKNLDDDTIVIFYSDNGTHAKVVSRMKDGREIQGGKATSKQTGIHVPLIAHWPGRDSATETGDDRYFEPGICDAIVDASDFVPTLAELGGFELPSRFITDGISFAPRLLGNDGPQRESVFLWYDPRPGWDKERFRRQVFALNADYKLFQSGRLYRLSDKSLEEVEINPLEMSDADRDAKQELEQVITRSLADVDEPALVDAYGNPQHDLLYVPSDKEETSAITKELLGTGEELVYGDADVTEHRLWVFNPLDIADDELRPCVIFIHGGGWGGTPDMLAPQCVYLQRRGINAVSIHFRAPRGGLTPADTLRDARRAYRWIVENGHKHHIDASQLVVSGGSAGGHLSLALATIDLKDDAVIDHLPRGLVLLNPVIDLVDGWSGGRKKCETAGIDPADFSPAHHVRAELPPTLVLSGSDDALIPPRLIRSFQKRMRDAGNHCTFVEYPNAGHGFFNYGRGGNQYFQWTMWEFERFLHEIGFQIATF